PLTSGRSSPINLTSPTSFAMFTKIPCAPICVSAAKTILFRIYLAKNANPNFCSGLIKDKRLLMWRKLEKIYESTKYDAYSGKVSRTLFTKKHKRDNLLGSYTKKL